MASTKQLIDAEAKNVPLPCEFLLSAGYLHFYNRKDNLFSIQ